MRNNQAPSSCSDRVTNGWLICHCEPVRLKFMSISPYWLKAVLLSSRKSLSPRTNFQVLVSQVLEGQHWSVVPSDVENLHRMWSLWRGRPINITVSQTWWYEQGLRNEQWPVPSNGSSVNCCQPPLSLHSSFILSNVVHGRCALSGGSNWQIQVIGLIETS